MKIARLIVTFTVLAGGFAAAHSKTTGPLPSSEPVPLCPNAHCTAK